MERRRDLSARDALEDMARAPLRALGLGAEDSQPAPEATRWALRGIDFEIGKGEVVGIVGGNGAGKSVLLKILSRVTRPTEGRVEIRGRVAPLLQLGAGFHSDLTGRDNIYLNGAILGMRRETLRRRVDEIVAFAEIAEFLDMPIKFYSSGMRMRLGFAVAAHLERDIFLIDEALAVGDFMFRQRCLERLAEMAAQGKTILLVSHGDQVVERLCSRAILLSRGRLLASGAPAEINWRYRSLANPPVKP